MAKRPSRQSLATGILIVLLAGLFISQALQAVAHHEPANKFAAAGSTMEVLEPGATDVILHERMKVSSPFDLLLQVNAECSILTSLFTQGSDQPGSTETDQAFGQVEMWVTLDGTRVPVSTADIDEDEEGTQLDDGEVVFCNREYRRDVADREDEEDGHDEEADFIRTRTANSFNWFALDVGVDCPDPEDPTVHCYDKVALNGNNIIDIELHVRFTKTECTNPAAPLGETCSDAIVGRRTLIAEPTNASVHEQVLQVDPGGS